MNDETKYEDLEAPSSEIVEITVRGRTSRFRLMDISSAAFQDAAAKMNVQDAAKAAEAKRLFQAKTIAMGAQRVDPPNGKSEKISIDEAASFPSALALKLQKEIMKFNGITDSEEEVKNA